MDSGRRIVDILFVVCLFALYLVCTFTLCIIGINVYQKSISDSSENYNIRTSVLYITEKSRQNLSLNGIRVDTVADSSALVLSNTIEGTVYNTWMYVEDGYLCEVLMPEGTEVIPDIGQKIMPMQKLELLINEDNLLSISVTDESGLSYSSSLYIHKTAQGVS